MRSSAFAIEQTSRSHQTHSRAHAGNGNTAGAAALQPGNNRRISLDHVVNAQSGGWHKDQIGLAHIFERDIRPNLNVAIALDRASVGRRGSHMETGSATGAGENVP